MSKYQSLWEYLSKNGLNEITISFSNLENILGFKINHSFLSCKKEAENYGYHVKKISFKEEFIIFERIV